jgi:uncharacterized protein (TIGR03067 family)
MKAFLTAAVGLMFLATIFAQESDDAVKKEEGLFKGTWKMESFETEQGKNDDLIGATLKFDAKNLEFIHRDETKKFTITVNPLGKPKEITFKADDKELPGIYKLEKDDMTICVNIEPNQPRPTEFATKNACWLITLKRAKD